MRMKEFFNDIGVDPEKATKTDWTLWTLLHNGRPVYTGRKDGDGNKIFTKEKWVSIGDFLENNCGTRYGARIHSLRHNLGYNIEHKKIYKSHYYRLIN